MNRQRNKETHKKPTQRLQGMSFVSLSFAQLIIYCLHCARSQAQAEARTLVYWAACRNRALKNSISHLSK